MTTPWITSPWVALVVGPVGLRWRSASRRGSVTGVEPVLGRRQQGRHRDGGDREVVAEPEGAEQHLGEEVEGRDDVGEPGEATEDAALGGAGPATLRTCRGSSAAPRRAAGRADAVRDWPDCSGDGCRPTHNAHRVLLDRGRSCDRRNSTLVTSTTFPAASFPSTSVRRLRWAHVPEHQDTAPTIRRGTQGTTTSAPPPCSTSGRSAASDHRRRTTQPPSRRPSTEWPPRPPTCWINWSCEVVPSPADRWRRPGAPRSRRHP